jgi:hypothetical protein
MFMTSVIRMISFSLSTFNFFVAFCFFPSFLRDFAHLSASFGLFGTRPSKNLWLWTRAEK